MTTPVSTSQLLAYNANHRILICRECKYAIQKSALGSHLLRHKIYRGERQRLLSSIARLAISEPDDVPLPPAGSPAVDGLPVIQGCRCTAAGCGNLCASAKRMRRHWSESHGVSDPPESAARGVHLQTFFRGTKLRYFEVAPPGDGAGARTLSPVTVTGGDGGLTLTVPTHGLKTSSRGGELPFTLDLEMLKYFHHFTTTTSLTLPNTQNHQNPAKHWQVDVVAHALEAHWLMCGLLAISASHLAALSDQDETTAKRAHLERAARFLQGFSAGWGEVKRGSQAAAAPSKEASMRTGAQMACIHRCCRWMSEAETGPQADLGGEMEQQELAPFQLHSFIQTVRGCSSPEFALRSAVGSNVYEMSEPSTNVQDKNDAPSQVLPPPAVAPPALLERIRTLPHRMQPLGKPDSALDFFATLSAIDTLAECCSLSYAAGGDVGCHSAWRAMESWLAGVPAHFGQMVARRNHAALVVLAHWSVLVERAESYCWFLRGAAAEVRRQAARELPQDSVIQGLIENLGG